MGAMQGQMDGCYIRDLRNFNNVMKKKLPRIYGSEGLKVTLMSAILIFLLTLNYYQVQRNCHEILPFQSYWSAKIY